MNEQTKLIGLVFIAGIAIALMWPFIRDPKFRQDLLSSEGEGSFKGVKIKGGTFLLLFFLLVGSFVFILMYEVKPKELSIEELIAKINQSEGDYQLKNDDNTIVIYKDSLKLAKLNIKTNKGLNTSKGSKKNSWIVSHEDVSRLGFIKMKHQENHVKRTDEIRKHVIGKETPHRIKKLDLYFRIDSVAKYTRKVAVDSLITGYDYWVTYGELDGESEDGSEFILWQNKSKKYIKTPNAQLNVASSFDIIQDASWKNNYFVGMGLGYPHKDSIFKGFEFIRIEYDYVELINVIALEYSIE